MGDDVVVSDPPVDRHVPVDRTPGAEGKHRALRLPGTAGGVVDRADPVEVARAPVRRDRTGTFQSCPIGVADGDPPGRARFIGQRDIRTVRGVPPVRYDAIRTGLVKVATFAAEKGASAHMPRIGAGLAGGDWNTIAGIITDELIEKGVAVTVYDLPT